jgi:hypothetical protein
MQPRLTRLCERGQSLAMTDADIATIANIIQLAVAPVFLLAGIGSILNVVAHRLARVVDRVRNLERDVHTDDADLRAQELRTLAILDRRMRLCHWSIGLCVAAALLISLVVIVLFVADLVSINFAVPVSLLFAAAMACLTLGLLLFLSEVTIATRSVRVDERFMVRGKFRP